MTRPRASGDEKLRDRLLEEAKAEPVAAPKKAPRGETANGAATGPSLWQCCRCGQLHQSLAAIERHCHAARHPRYRQIMR
jgi:hypothetical protein